MASRLTQAKRSLFLGEYAKCGIVCEAARRAQVDRTKHYEWLKDPEYKRDFDAAHQAACEMLEAECQRRAVEGDEEPVVYQGEIQYETDGDGFKRPVTVRRKSDILLMFLMKGTMPEKYRDTFKGEIKHSGAVSTGPDLTKLTDEQLKQAKALALIANGGAGPHGVNGSISDPSGNQSTGEEPN